MKQRSSDVAAQVDRVEVDLVDVDLADNKFPIWTAEHMYTVHYFLIWTSGKCTEFSDMTAQEM